ncbi:MAG: glycosyltransferase [Spirosomaceae bacterium]|nr:glycosyltransferase [Spirosomataceae bacterium]
MELFYATNWFSYPLVFGFLLLFGLVLLAQLYFILFVFAKITPKSVVASSTLTPSVTVVVSAHNELHNLQELLPMLNEQDYPDFEVIIIDDRSTDGTLLWLEENASVFEKIRFIRVEKEYEHVTPKKYALTTAIRSAKNDIILLTDADCRPTTDQWVKGMAACLDNDKQIVLGFSPYQRLSGFLNRLIRFETFFVAVQYLSFALIGKPYMGVGRNLMYRKSLFLQNKGFYTHIRVTGGDDDLLINEIATSTNTAVCLDPDTFMVSWPKETWAAWFRQKKRHLSISKYYKAANKRRLGVLTATHILTWSIFIGLMIWSAVIFPQQQGFLIVVASLFVLRWVVQWVVLGIASSRLGHIVGWGAIPFMDFILFVYYIVMGLVMWFNRKKKVKWR